jgi:DNA polymerase III delta subunit
MIYIVHGEDLAKSRALIQNQQKKVGAQSRIELDIADITPEQLHEKSRSNDLFGNPPFIVIDISNAGRSNMDPYIDKMEKVPDATTVIILSNKTLPKTNIFIKNSSRFRAKPSLNELAPQSNIFNLVDAVFYKQREKSYLELSKLLKDNVSPFEIFTMLFYGLRTVASAKFESPSIKKAHSFVQSKAMSQAKLFDADQIISLFEKFREIDKKSKLSEIDNDLIIPIAIETVLNS